MKYPQGTELKCIDSCRVHGRSLFTIDKEYKVSEIWQDGRIVVVDDFGANHTFIEETIGDYFTLINRSHINPNNSKYDDEQRDYLDKCAIAAMQGMLANSIDTNQGMQPFWSMEDSKIASIAYGMAESMLAERERRKLS